MIEYQVIYMSADRRRVQLREIMAADIDSALGIAMHPDTIALWAGTGAAWFVAGIVQLDCVSETAAALEEVL